MPGRKAGTANGEVAAPCDRETKVTALAGRTIDAPVENKPLSLQLATERNRGTANNRICGEAVKIGYDTLRRYE